VIVTLNGLNPKLIARNRKTNLYLLFWGRNFVHYVRKKVCPKSFRLKWRFIKWIPESAAADAAVGVLVFVGVVPTEVGSGAEKTKC
jgi:hypothetical protein